MALSPSLFVRRSGSSLAAALTSAAFALMLAGCGSSQPAAGPPGAGGFAMPVEVATLAPTPIDDIAEFVGIVRSRRSTTIQPQAEGIITAIRTKSGDHVSRGAVLFEIDAAPQRAVVASLTSQRAAQAANVAFARQQAQRAKNLLDVGATSQQEYEQAMTQQQTAEAQLKSIDDQITQQQAELDYYRVVAPTEGIVGDVPVRVGDRVTKTTPLTTIDASGGLEVYINVPVQQAPRLKIGLPVRLVDESGKTLATERINFIAPAVDDATQTVLVKTPLASNAGFRTDQYVRTQIVFTSAPGLTIPVTAVTRVNGQYFVFLAESNGKGGTVARQRPVTLGRVIGNAYVLESGAKAGDTLIVSGIQKIGDGAPVTPTPARAGGAGAAAAGPAPAGGR
jgi:RND family efflux transporter MFP subunit